MVLEWILEARKDRKHPINIFLFAAAVSLVSLFISYKVFEETTGLFTVVLISLATVPFINKMLFYEEVETEKSPDNESFWERHGDIIIAFAALFAGMTLAMSTVYVVLPDDVAKKVFSEQMQEIQRIQSNIVGRFLTPNTFVEIFANNLSVLFLAFLFSLILGTGAILILAWNASVLSAAIGAIADSQGGLSGIPIGILTFLPHGTFELTGYFIGAIAGGLISMAVRRRNSPRFNYIIADSLKLLVVAILLLFVGGIIETIILS